MNPITLWRQIRALLAVKKEINKMSINELKTSEGRLTLLLNVVAIYGSLKGFIPAPLAAKVAVISVAVYAIARSLVKAAEAIAKATPTPKDDAMVAEVGKLVDVLAPKAPAPPEA